VDKGVGKPKENARICGADRRITASAPHGVVEKLVYKPVLRLV